MKTGSRRTQGQQILAINERGISVRASVYHEGNGIQLQTMPTHVRTISCARQSRPLGSRCALLLIIINYSLYNARTTIVVIFLAFPPKFVDTFKRLIHDTWWLDMCGRFLLFKASWGDWFHYFCHPVSTLLVVLLERLGTFCKCPP